MKRDNRVVGMIGEGVAVRVLMEKGYEIVERNFGTKFGEIDVIAKDGETLVFVEVKAKKGANFGLPEEMFTKGKMTKVKRMATVYLRGEEVKCRIDMVAVVLSPENEAVRVTHYENVTGGP